MKLALKQGTYIVAVSGGVDSVVLLDMLTKQKDLKLVIAHFDHGIREDSVEDQKFVEGLSESYVLPFVYAKGNLGSDASEAQAREARYAFLRAVKQKYKADAIITAHHQDYLIETIIINILRGTGRKGVTSLGESEDTKRPLLSTTKKEILDYAKKNKLEWREDSTNTNTDYLRNWVRHTIVPKLTPADRKKFLSVHETLSKHNPAIDKLLASYIQKEVDKLPKNDVVNADHTLAKELIANWLRANGIREFDQKNIERIVIGAKTLATGKKIPVNKGVTVLVGKDMLTLKHG